MAGQLLAYDRRSAVDYAHRWAYGRNPNYYDYSEIGGDCTNFASQCLYIGTGIMNLKPVYGWYYRTGNDKAPAWTGAPYFYRFMTRTEESSGPVAVKTALSDCLPGDFVQFDLTGTHYSHTAIIVSMGDSPTQKNTLVTAHSNDVDYRSLDTYAVQSVRFLHVLGVRK